MSQSYAVKPEFITGTQGQLFSVTWSPIATDVVAGVVFIPGFAEEMNKSRHLVAQAARSLATSGFVVQVVDLFGCGDSSGELHEASWDTWVSDIVNALSTLSNQLELPVHLWGQRAGALLAHEVSGRDDTKCSGLLLWQPVANGKNVLNEFLRLRTAAGIISGDANVETVADLRERLMAGETLEVAGYELPTGIARGLEAASLNAPPAVQRAHIIELGKKTSPVVSRLCKTWQEAGVATAVDCVAGPPFWRSAELGQCPALIDATVAALSTWHR